MTPKFEEVDDTISSFLETEIMTDSTAQIAVVVMSADGRVRAISGGRPSEKIQDNLIELIRLNDNQDQLLNPSFTELL